MDPRTKLVEKVEERLKEIQSSMAKEVQSSMAEMQQQLNQQFSHMIEILTRTITKCRALRSSSSEDELEDEHSSPHTEEEVSSDEEGEVSFEGSKQESESEITSLLPLSSPPPLQGLEAKNEGTMGSIPNMGGSDWNFQKSDIPLLDGNNPKGWIQRAERYFKFYQLQEKDKIEAFVVALEGDTSYWYHWEHHGRLIKNWEELKGLIRHQFRSSNRGEPCEQRLEDHQVRMMTEHKTAPLKEITEQITLGFRKYGLKKDNWAEIRSLGSHNLDQKMDSNKDREKLSPIEIKSMVTKLTSQSATIYPIHTSASPSPLLIIDFMLPSSESTHQSLQDSHYRSKTKTPSSSICTRTQNPRSSTRAPLAGGDPGFTCEESLWRVEGRVVEQYAMEQSISPYLFAFAKVFDEMRGRSTTKASGKKKEEEKSSVLTNVKSWDDGDSKIVSRLASLLTSYSSDYLKNLNNGDLKFRSGYVAIMKSGSPLTDTQHFHVNQMSQVISSIPYIAYYRKDSNSNASLLLSGHAELELANNSSKGSDSLACNLHVLCCLGCGIKCSQFKSQPSSLQLMRARQRFKTQLRLIQGTWTLGATDDKLCVLEKPVPKVDTTPIIAKPKPVSPLPTNTTASEPQLPPKDKERRVPMARLRKEVVTRLKDSQNTSALLTTSNEVDMPNLVNLGSEYKDAFLEKHKVKLGLMFGVVKAVVSGLQNQPIINAVMDEDGIIYKDCIDNSIIVGTPKGFVSVIRNAEKKAGLPDVYDFPPVQNDEAVEEIGEVKKFQ